MRRPRLAGLFSINGCGSRCNPQRSICGPASRNWSIAGLAVLGRCIAGVTDFLELAALTIGAWLVARQTAAITQGLTSEQIDFEQQRRLLRFHVTQVLLHVMRSDERSSPAPEALH